MTNFIEHDPDTIHDDDGLELYLCLQMLQILYFSIKDVNHMAELAAQQITGGISYVKDQASDFIDQALQTANSWIGYTGELFGYTEYGNSDED